LRSSSAGTVDVEIVDPRSIVPLDEETILRSVRKTGRLLVVHEAPTAFGIGGEIVRRICETAFDALRAAPRVLGGLSVPMPFSGPLEEACVPSTEQIVRALTEMAR
jgi:pyruvate dehydrogenase E1 component beta subunit